VNSSSKCPEALVSLWSGHRYAERCSSIHPSCLPCSWENLSIFLFFSGLSPRFMFHFSLCVFFLTSRHSWADRQREEWAGRLLKIETLGGKMFGLVKPSGWWRSICRTLSGCQSAVRFADHGNLAK
jgi:hypothetical protein